MLDHHQVIKMSDTNVPYFLHDCFYGDSHAGHVSHDYFVLTHYARIGTVTNATNLHWPTSFDLPLLTELVAPVREMYIRIKAYEAYVRDSTAWVCVNFLNKCSQSCKTNRPIDTWRRSAQEQRNNLNLERTALSVFENSILSQSSLQLREEKRDCPRHSCGDECVRGARN